MGGWSGGVYSRFRNWVTDKANSINPQASLFDQEDDGFAAGLNNCVTKDGLNKPSSAMDWNGQNLTGVLNFANTGTTSLAGGQITVTAGGAATLNNSLVTNGSVSFNNLSGAITLKGNASGNSAINYIQFSDSLGARSGYIGKVNAGDAHIYITADLGDIRLNPKVGNSAAMTLDGSTYFDVGWRDCPPVTTGVNYTTVITDRGKSISATVSAITITIAANASVAYPTGTVLTFINQSSGNISIAINTDTLILAGTGTGGTRTLAQNGLASAIKINSTQWIISGAGLS